MHASPYAFAMLMMLRMRNRYFDARRDLPDALMRRSASVEPHASERYIAAQSAANDVFMPDLHTLSRLRCHDTHHLISVIVA